MRGPGGPRALAGAAAGLALGAAIGGALGPRWGAALTEPMAVDEAIWDVGRPGQADRLAQPGLGRDTHLRAGMLRLGEHAFGRMDVVRPVEKRVVSEVWLDVGEGAVRLNFNEPGQAGTTVTARPDGVRINALQHQGWIERTPGPLRVTVSDGQAAAHVEGRALGLGGATGVSVELLSAGGGALRSVKIIDRDGEVFLDQDFGALSPSPPAWIGAAIGAAAGACLGAALALSAGPLGALWALLLGALPLLILRAPFAAWLALVEALYLTRTPAWDLARGALLASMVPLFLLTAARVIPPLERTTRRRPGAWRWLYPGACAAAGLLASRGGQWLWFVPGTLYLLHGWRVAQQARLPGPGWLAREAPALVSVAWLGWGLGLLPAALWRFVPVVSSSRTLLERAPRAAADHLFLLLLALPLSAELALRSTYLSDAWSPEALGAERPHDAIALGELDDKLSPYWKGRCGPAGAARELSLVFLGGSSTGGAYQFNDEPEAFFAARTHALICADLPPDTALTTWNYGAGGRDTHVISRAIGPLLARTEADALVVYTGVNDLLTETSNLTRRQREEQIGSDEVASSLSDLGGRSRLITGLALYSKGGGEADAETVPEVPLPDARENLAVIAAAGPKAGARVLLSSQFVVPSKAPLLEPYWVLEKELAAAAGPEVRFVDVRPDFAGLEPRSMLLDNNHFSREGHKKLASALVDDVKWALKLTEEAG